ncbi:hypothetical protein [Spartinivicinus poritis]|uniref:Uncharacterized protein n=1 Tax=Spartinivicinus poritis TaxID=2994640 RepID=A0ABT5U5V4_9GAMM|nr:hypothetical protein [Spartinivicinus sp. A2-2]MDE1461739.1 hypothetical protein [Spartinivicinus sp. A2-2]
MRRAFLCGEDQLTGQSFEHRRQWVVDRLTELAAVDNLKVATGNDHHMVIH